MTIATRSTYLSDLSQEMIRTWPNNRLVNIVCHGHSVPAGYFRTPVVDTFGAYPHQLHLGLMERFPTAVINVIVTAIGGENAESGNLRFQSEVLCHRPDLVIIDYGTNDRGLGLERAAKAWRSMIQAAKDRRVRVILMTPAHDVYPPTNEGHAYEALRTQHASQIRQLASEFEVGLADGDAVFADYRSHGGELTDLLSQINHPNRLGHTLLARDVLRWFPVA